MQDPEAVNRYLRLGSSITATNSGALVEQVLAYAASRKGAALATRQPIVIEELLGEAHRELGGSRIRAAECEVEFTASPKICRVRCRAIQARCGALSQNLIVNAAKHGGGGHWIRREHPHQAMAPHRAAASSCRWPIAAPACRNTNKARSSEAICARRGGAEAAWCAGAALV